MHNDSPAGNFTLAKDRMSQRRSARYDSLVHLVAGAAGGTATAVLTSPLDVLRTRLQSNFYTRSPTSPATFSSAFRSLHAIEGLRGYFVGLGPSMVGVIPATTIKFFVYGNSKQTFASIFDLSKDEPIIQAQAATAAALVTATLTNPIWVVKTRLQLDGAGDARGDGARPHYRNSWDCVNQIARHEGIRAFYRGLTASYLGSIETTLHLVLYERLKNVLSRNIDRVTTRESWYSVELSRWITTTGAAALAKGAAIIVAYPHEVIRTRLREAPDKSGRPRYTGVFHCCRTIWAREGFRGMYGGLIPHVLRSIPSAMISLGVYEFVLRRSGLLT